VYKSLNKKLEGFVDILTRLPTSERRVFKTMQSFPVCLIHMSVSNGKNKINKSVAIVGNSAISNIDIYSYWKDKLTACDSRRERI